MMNDTDTCRLKELSARMAALQEQIEEFWKQRIKPAVEECKTSAELASLQRHMLQAIDPQELPGCLQIEMVFAISNIRWKEQTNPPCNRLDNID